MTLNRLNLSPWISTFTAVTALVKIALAELSIGEALAMLFILALIQASRIIDYKFPERPDLYSEVADYKKRIEELEHDVTALKFGVIKK